MAETIARKVLWPNDDNILVRVAFLYVGQGASAIVFMKAPNGYKVLVVDINLDRKNGGIDVPRLVEELMDGQEVEAFVNTHPHNDHLCGTAELSDAVTINNVWHSGHKPGKDDESKYQELKDLIKKVTDAGGEETILEGSNDTSPVGLAEFHVLAPAAYVTDDVNDETPQRRRERIHEQCTVIKFGKDDQWIMIVGDADRRAFEDHITKYHKENLPSFCLAASHHGSDTFFRENEDEEEYMDALNTINPEFVVVSAPTLEESPHGHPCEFAMEKYEDQCGEESVFHTGEDRFCFYFDIFNDGTHSDAISDEGKLAEEYGFDDEDDDGGESKAATGPFVHTSSREQSGEYQPRQYG